MTTRDEVKAAVRAFVRDEIAKDPALEIGDEDPLISGGVLTSLDIVTLVAFLETRFGAALDSRAPLREDLDSLEKIAALVAGPGEGERPAAKVVYAARPRLLPALGVRPGRVLVGVLVAFALVDLAARAAMPWVLPRLEPREHDRCDYDYPSFEQALARHDLGLVPKAPGEVRIVALGDSGTFGSYLDSREACYAVADRLVREKHPRARVYNCSYFGQTFVKDAALVEASLAYAPDVVVVALSSRHFDRKLQEADWLRPATPVVYNRALFRRFLAHVPGGLESPELGQLDRVLEDSERRAGFPLLHALESVSAIASNGVGLRELRFLEPVRVVPRARDAWRASCRCLAHATWADAGEPAPIDLDVRAVVLLEKIVERARGAGVEVVLFREPEPAVGVPARRVRFDAASWERLDAIVGEVAGRHGLAVADGRDLVPQGEFLDNDRHWTAEGNARLGRAIAEALEPRLEAIERGR